MTTLFISSIGKELNSNTVHSVFCNTRYYLGAKNVRMHNAFINAIINFLITAFVLFLTVRTVNKIKEENKEAKDMKQSASSNDSEQTEAEEEKVARSAFRR